MDKDTMNRILDLSSELLAIDTPIPDIDGIDSTSFNLGFSAAKISGASLLMKAVKLAQDIDLEMKGTLK